MAEIIQKIPFGHRDQTLRILGKKDEILKILESEFNISVIGRGSEIALKGEKENVSLAKKAMEKIIEALENLPHLTQKDMLTTLRMVKEEKVKEFDEMLKEKIEVSSKRKYIIAKNPAQKRYIESIRKNEIIFSIGPAGTGKTYLGMAMAVNYLITKRVGRLILVRPAVEAGEKLGFLPGDLYEKISPYLRPLYDALYEMLDAEELKQYLDRGIIEIAPLAYMRGRTFNDSFIVLDEAQNSTAEQMKMFLTRLGFDSKVIVTGDITQVDLPDNTTSGLIQVQYILKGIDGIDFIYFTEKDVVRHKLVQEIVRAYGNHKKNKTQVENI